MTDRQQQAAPFALHLFHTRHRKDLDALDALTDQDPGVAKRALRIFNRMMPALSGQQV